MNILGKILEKKEFSIPQKIEGFIIKFYEESDFKELMNLYEIVFPGFMSKELWLWKNMKNPFGPFITIVIKDREKIIAAYSVSPREFFIKGKVIPCVLSLDTMTHPNYQKIGISTFLAKLTYEYAKLNGFYFVYGFPNNNSIYMFEKKLDWINFGQSELLIKNISGKIKQIDILKKYSVHEIRNFNNEYENFWEKNCRNLPIIINKKKDYLNWRYVEHPFVKYRIFLVKLIKTREIVSYFVLKTYTDKNEIRGGHIVDIFIRTGIYNNRKEIFKIIENHSRKEFQEKCSKISFWMPDNYLKNLSLKKLKYKLVKTDPFFGFKLFKNCTYKISNLNTLSDWYITMANDDVF